MVTYEVGLEEHHIIESNIPTSEDTNKRQYRGVKWWLSVVYRVGVLIAP